MNKFGYLAFMCVMLVGLSGCDHTTVYVEDGRHVYGPELEGFYIVDSEGKSSEFVDEYELVVDPYMNGGLFEFYWDMNSYDDYSMFLSVNSEPGLDGAIDISQEFCGYDFSCDTSGIQVCEYTPDFMLGCGVDLYEAHRNLQPIEELFWDIPDTIYFNLEVCDDSGYHCEVSSVPVYML